MSDSNKNNPGKEPTPDKQQPGKTDPPPVQPSPDKPEIEPTPEKVPEEVPDREVPRKPADPQSEQAFNRKSPD
ncbi:MAG TPA: hypothetical protein VM802_25965 [Chitinophaga sp.]|uniref:hypothetical protein n=1 Tax=Chitinophaga sp. TaxID=1869181 RepID=UPI002BCCD92E|nr:hypothetical protein [Chitinophaga sp.]HVI48342.1 hypothetical protein [Chitinophaga sp.]